MHRLTAPPLKRETPLHTHKNRDRCENMTDKKSGFFVRKFGPVLTVLWFQEALCLFFERNSKKIIKISIVKKSSRAYFKAIKKVLTEKFHFSPAVKHDLRSLGDFLQ